MAPRVNISICRERPRRSASLRKNRQCGLAPTANGHNGARHATARALTRGNRTLDPNGPTGYVGSGEVEPMLFRNATSPSGIAPQVYQLWANAPTSNNVNSEYINSREKYINSTCSAPPPSPPSAFKSPGFLAGARVQDPHWGYRPLNQAAGHERVAYGRRGGGGIWGEHPVCGGSEANAPRPSPPAEASTGVDGLPGVGRRRDGLVGSSGAAARRSD